MVTRILQGLPFWGSRESCQSHGGKIMNCGTVGQRPLLSRREFAVIYTLLSLFLFEQETRANHQDVCFYFLALNVRSQRPTRRQEDVPDPSASAHPPAD